MVARASKLKYSVQHDATTSYYSLSHTSQGPCQRLISIRTVIIAYNSEIFIISL